MRRDDQTSQEVAAETTRLVRAARAGDHAAFGRLVEIHQGAVTRLAYRLLGDRDDADGATQEAFIKAWARLGQFREECPFGAWVSRIAVNQCRDRLKRSKLVVMENGACPLDEVVDASPGPESRAAGREIARRIAEQVRRLPGMQREVFTLRYYDDRSLAEIAALFRVDVGTIKTHLFRATHRIRRSLEALYGQRLPL